MTQKLKAHLVQNASVLKASLESSTDIAADIDVSMRGPKGDAANITIGTVTTVDYDQPATVTNVGTSHDAILNFEIPKGKDSHVADQVAHKLIIGNYQFDGSEEITIPIYNGE